MAAAITRVAATVTSITSPAYARLAVSSAGVLIVLHLGFSYGLSLQDPVPAVYSVLECMSETLSELCTSHVAVAILGFCLYPAVSWSTSTVMSVSWSNSTVKNASTKTGEREDPHQASSASGSVTSIATSVASAPSVSSCRFGTPAEPKRPRLINFFRNLKKHLSFLRPKNRTDGSRRPSQADRQSKTGRSFQVPLSRCSSNFEIPWRENNHARWLRHKLQELKHSWKPRLSTILAVQQATLLEFEGSMASEDSQQCNCKAADVQPCNGHLAVDCVGNDVTPPVNQGLKQVITEQHLLQFAALIGESSASLALSQKGAPGAISSSALSFFGQTDNVSRFKEGWDQILDEHRPGIRATSFRQYLRNNLYMYKSTVVYENVTVPEVMAYTFDEAFRMVWDDAAAQLKPICPPDQRSLTPAEVEALAFGRSTYMYARSKFPGPVCCRDYVYARRVWLKQDDGGCYCLNKVAEYPAPPLQDAKGVLVTDYASGYVIRAAQGAHSSASPAVEVVTVYFENAQMNSTFANAGIRRCMWGMMQKAEVALRRFQAERYENVKPRLPAIATFSGSLGPTFTHPASKQASEDSLSTVSRTSKYSTGSHSKYGPVIGMSVLNTKALWSYFSLAATAIPAAVTSLARAPAAITQWLLSSVPRLGIWSYNSIILPMTKRLKLSSGQRHTHARRQLSSHPIDTSPWSPPPRRAPARNQQPREPHSHTAGTGRPRIRRHSRVRRVGQLLGAALRIWIAQAAYHRQKAMDMMNMK